MKNIKNLIFDLGGVIYDIRYENVAEAFVRHGVTNLSDIFSRSFQTREIDLFEEGRLSPDEIRVGIASLANAPLSGEDVDDILNAILIDIPAHRVACLLALKEKYNVFLFSNTNQINYDFYTTRMKEKFGFDIFDRCFHKAYFSHIMHIRKPAAEGFQMILDEQHLCPSETLFIDDNAPNFVGARQVGMKVFHLHDMDMTEMFDDGFNLKVQPE